MIIDNIAYLEMDTDDIYNLINDKIDVVSAMFISKRTAIFCCLSNKDAETLSKMIDQKVITTEYEKKRTFKKSEYISCKYIKPCINTFTKTYNWTTKKEEYSYYNRNLNITKPVEDIYKMCETFRKE